MTGAGVRTLKRVALVNTLVRERGEDRPGLLDQVLRVVDQLVAEGGPLHKSFYQGGDRGQGPGLGPSAPIFYSAVLRAAKGAKQEKAFPAQWLGMLRNRWLIQNP